MKSKMKGQDVIKSINKKGIPFDPDEYSIMIFSVDGSQSVIGFLFGNENFSYTKEQLCGVLGIKDDVMEKIIENLMKVNLLKEGKDGYKINPQTPLYLPLKDLIYEDKRMARLKK